MKKIILFSTFLLALGSAKAQSFTSEKDTSKSYWAANGIPVDIKNRITASSSNPGPIKIDWSVSDIKQDPGWILGSICEPFGNCYGATTPGLTAGTTFTSPDINPGFFASFIVDFDADAAAVNTSSYVIINVTSGATTKKVAMYGYKSPTGIVTTSYKVEEEISIFPNPASNYIDVRYSQSSDVKSITIYNLIGKVVNVYKVTDKNSARCEFNADMPSGIYFVRIADSKGNVIATRKITHQ